jgi:hypothetical protein
LKGLEDALVDETKAEIITWNLFTPTEFEFMHRVSD